MEKLPGTIDIFVEHEGVKMPLWIQPRCRLRRLKEVTGDALCVVVKEVTLKGEVFPKKGKILKGDDLFMIEDHGVRNGSILVVEAEADSNKSQAKFQYPMMSISFVDEKDRLLNEDVKISSTCSVKILLDTLEQSRQFIPGSISLWFQDKQLSSSEVVSNIVPPGGKVVVKASLFPFFRFPDINST